MAETATKSSNAPTTPAAPSSERAVIACQRLTKTFRDFWMRPNAKAVDALDMVVHQREIFGLLGPNGSGKSTTIKMILGLLRPTSGRVAVFGKPPTDVLTKKRIGYLPEESYLYPFLNARETLEYYAKLFEIDPKTRNRRIDELLDMVGLQHTQFRPVREYSKGMQRRIGLAQALINDPELLILDEPTTGLDPIGTRQVKDLILELGRRGKTVILSSHLLADVEDVVSRMVILYGGRVRGEGTCDELLGTHDRTTIETDGLDEDTIAEIDRLIRERSGGTKSIQKVAQPRQKLEELFLGIVEQAKAERLETAGATHGGNTAAFLRSEDSEEQGDELISRLVEATDHPVAPLPTDDQPDATTANDQDDSGTVIDSLMADHEQPDDSQATPSPESAGDTAQTAPEPEEDFDHGVIDSLLGDTNPADEIDDPEGDRK